MQIHHLSVHSLPQASSPEQPQWMAVGEFDGVHLGHQAVIRRAVEEAAQFELPASVMTFHPHPRSVLGSEHHNQVLTPLKDKLVLLERLGVSRVYVVNFDQHFAELPPEQFVERFLVGLNVQTAVVGFDFTFGHQGTGTPDTLCELAAGRFAVEVVRPFHLDGVKVSSTLIRNHIRNHAPDKAAIMLGRPYSVKGTVVRGVGRGRTIGVPTANLELSDCYLVPGTGVYAVQAMVNGERLAGVMNIGVKPTFAEDGLNRTLEVHLLDYEGSIYGQEMTVEFIGFIRHEKKFASAEELLAQIREDIAKAKKILAT